MIALVEIRNLSHRFGTHHALDDVSLTIEPASYAVLLGPSGSGKTTLLSILGGFLVPSAGKVLIRGKDCTAMPPAARPTTTVFQDYALFPHMSVGANVGFGLRMRGVARAERDRRAAEALALVGLEAAFGKKPHQLSGGQRQRVALARALVVEPAVLLLDEPLGALDLKLRRQMQDELKALQKRVGTAFVHVTHDQEEAMALADHCVVMNAGRIEDHGPPERVYARPATRFAATFMGESTLVPGRAATGPDGRLVVETAIGRVTLEGGAHVGDVTLAIRPENIRFSPRPGDIALGTAEIVETVFQGSYRRVTARSTADPDIVFSAKIAAGESAEPGTVVPVHCDPAAIVVLER